MDSIITYFLLFTSLYTEVFLLVTFFELRSSITLVDNQDPREYPSVTIIVPCFNEEKTIGGTIMSLLELNYPKDKLSIFIVDDGSTDATVAVAQKFQNNQNVKIFRKENGGKHTAFNLGLMNTTSDLVGCLDADSFVDPNALRRIVLRFENAEVMAVTPAMKVHEPKTIIQLMQKAEYTMAIFNRKVLSFLGSLYITPGPFSIFRKSVFDKLGLYRKAYNTEDLEFGLRMQTHGLIIENAHDAYVYTATPRTVRALLKQRIRWSYGFFKNAFDHRALFFNRKYGNLSSFVLPIAILSLTSVVYFVIRFLLQTFSASYNAIVKILTVGIHFGAPGFPDWFFLNTGFATILGITSVMFVFALILLGKWLSSEGGPRISRDMFYFVALYAILAPLWITKAAYDAVLSHETPWR
ncbi:MAG: glycosyltransferase [Candidatus Jorgensenbacteria bacterium]|nr:glycosyltransferase [Candidatus Jorgensenbacteria bacterium]